MDGYRTPPPGSKSGGKNSSLGEIMFVQDQRVLLLVTPNKTSKESKFRVYIAVPLMHTGNH